jgi:hypothetical protein
LAWAASRVRLFFALFHFLVIGHFLSLCEPPTDGPSPTAVGRGRRRAKGVAVGSATATR